MAPAPLGSEARPVRVAVIGSGPSAFYATEALFKAPLHVRVDMFDRLPTPYGLVRGGVAPDHQNIKAVVKIYEKIAEHERFRFFGNVKLGRDIEVADLVELYDQIVYAVGNESDRKMNVPGENLRGVHAATAFVGWYNGHPDWGDHEFELPEAQRAVVIGNGNVAMDVTRVLVQDPDQLATTDIADYAIAALRQSRVTEVVLLGRRGPAQAAFSPKEIQEIADLPNVDLVVSPDDVALDDLSRRWLEKDAPRSAQRNVKFLVEQAQKDSGAKPKRVRCHFLSAPTEILGVDGRVRGVRVERQRLVAGDDGTPRPIGTGEIVDIEAQLVFKAIGYRGVPIRGVPFDDRSGIIPNADGRVLDRAGGDVVPRQYVVGWAKRGPTGLIGTNSADSKATVEQMKQDLAGAVSEPLPGDDAERLPALLRARGIDWVSYDDWRALDAFEQECGTKRGRVRDKLCKVDEMLRVIRELRARR